MDNNRQDDKTPRMASKSFLTLGPTLHYSHANVQGCWLLTLLVFGITACFWNKIVNGTFWSFNIETSFVLQQWHLDKAVTAGVSIFEYPWQILVLGLLMGVLAVVPVLVSQLMSFGYSVPLVLEIFFLANLPGFAIFVLVSCFAAACRPLRFRSRFIAIALCTAPQLAYWGFFGGAKAVEPVKWGFSFAPWICAWLVGLSLAGLVLGVGHFLRYRPGLVWSFTTVFLVLAVVTFEMRIGFDELDFQLYVANNDPEDVSEFHDHSITEALNETVADPMAKRYFSGPFYPTEPNALRAELKSEMRAQLLNDSWPLWFLLPAELNYQPKRQWLMQQYNTFIERRAKSRRMPVVLYFRALLNEYSPDPELLEQKEMLGFYSDYPFERSRADWWRLLKDFGESPEAIEARYRIAMHLAGQGAFEQAEELIGRAQAMAAERIELLGKGTDDSDSLLRVFITPADSVMTKVKLEQLFMRLNKLRDLIGPGNRTDNADSKKRLSRFVMLNSHASDYQWNLERLLEQAGDKDPLQDNILLAKAKLITNDQGRAERFSELHRQYEGTDGGKEALYELARLRIRQYQVVSDAERKKGYLTEARSLLTSFISRYPGSFCAEQAKKTLDELPKVDGSDQTDVK